MNFQFLFKGIIVLFIIALTSCGGGSEPESSPTVKPSSSSSGSSSSASNKPIYVDSIIPFRKGTQVPTAVRQECNLGGNLSKFIDSAAEDYSNNIQLTSNLKKARGRVLNIEITNVHGLGGGAYSGAKSVTIEGTLKENGKVVGTFTGSRYSGGGFWGGFKGTCSILGRCVKTLGDDVAQWLESPYKGARLGDSK